MPPTYTPPGLFSAFCKNCLPSFLCSASFVDTFFFLSGFLAAYIGLKKLRGNRAPGWKVWAGYMWERWIRLTPTYLFILAFYINLVPFLAAGPDSNSSEDVYVGPGGPPHHGPHHTPEEVSFQLHPLRQSLLDGFAYVMTRGFDATTQRLARSVRKTTVFPERR